MDNRPQRFEAKRIFGLDLSKKTLKACRLDGDSGFEKQSIFDEKMMDDGRQRLALRLRKGDYVTMGGGVLDLFPGKVPYGEHGSRHFRAQPVQAAPHLRVGMQDGQTGLHKNFKVHQGHKSVELVPDSDSHLRGDIHEKPDQQSDQHKTGTKQGNQPDACLPQSERRLVPEEKLRIYKMTAIDSRCFGECLK